MIYECNIATANNSFFYYVEVPDHPDGREELARTFYLSEWIRENMDDKSVHRFFDKTLTRYFFTTYEDAFAFQMVVP